VEDVVEAIVGDIEDEHDVEEGPRLQKIADGWLVDARVSIEEFQAQTGLALDDETRDAGIDTVGGAVAAIAGRVPGRGEVIRHVAGCEFEIIDADPRRVKRVRIHTSGDSRLHATAPRRRKTGDAETEAAPAGSATSEEASPDTAAASEKPS
ncbi:MAG: transporter associated domain-containing protein, partial [bacterium]